MDHLRVEASRLLDCSIADNTKRAYSSALRDFLKFRMDHDLPDEWPFPIIHIVQYIAYMSLNNKAASTVAVHISAISREHKLRGMSDPSSHFIVQKMLQGLRKSVKQVDNRAPITVNILSQMPRALHVVCFSRYESVMFQAIFSLAFFAFLRVGEIVFTTQQDSDRAIQISDVKMMDTYMEITIRKSKTDQLGSGTTLRISELKEQNVCPVQAMQSYLAIRSNGNGYLFVHFNKKQVTRSQFAKVLSKALAFLQINDKYYSTHSFRIGAATAAAMRGISQEKIQLWGRWNSDAYLKYIRMPCLL